MSRNRRWLACFAPLAMYAVLTADIGIGRGDSLPGEVVDESLVAATRASQSPVFDSCINDVACAFTPAATPCPQDAKTKKCTGAGSGCAACKGQSKTCTGPVAAVLCGQFVTSCCNSASACKNTANGCQCNAVAPPVASGTKNMC